MGEHAAEKDAHRPNGCCDHHMHIADGSCHCDTVREALRGALTPGLMDMLVVRFPAWESDTGGYRYAEFVDRIAGIVADAGCVLPPAEPEAAS